MKKLVLIGVFVLSGLQLSAQENQKQRISLNTVRHSSLISLTYTRLWQPFENTNWRVGLGTGYGSRLHLKGGDFGGHTLPLFGLVEYGRTHQVGLSLGYAYRFRFYRHPSAVFVDNREITVFTDYHMLTSSLYYRYSFGKDRRYFIGAGAEFFIPFGETMGQEVQWQPSIKPTLQIGLWF